MRIILLPITTRRALIYCQRPTQVGSARPTLVDRATTRAAKLWIQWERSETRWQQLIVQYGNKALRRIPYEEWGLKSIPPRSTKYQATGEKTTVVELAYPSFLRRPEPVMETLRRLATERRAFHQQRLWLSVIGMVITLPIGILPM